MKWSVDPSQARHDLFGIAQDHTPDRASKEHINEINTLLEAEVTHLINGCNFDSTWHYLRFHLLSTIFIELSLVAVDTALIYLTE